MQNTREIPVSIIWIYKKEEMDSHLLGMQRKPLDDTQETNSMGGEMGERRLFAVCLFITLNFKPWKFNMHLKI